MAHASTAMLEVDKIDIEPGFNARTEFDEDALERLADSIGEAGVVQSILVRPKGDGRYWLTAGERRLKAAQRKELDKVPVVIREGTRAEAVRDSLLENMHKESLNVIDKARGVRMLTKEFDLRTDEEVADKLKIGRTEVGLLRRLLELPEGAQRYIAAGTVPETAERQLRMVAAVCPRVAECVCEYAMRQKVDRGDFVRNFDQILWATTQARFIDAPTMIRVGRLNIAKLVSDKEKRRDLIDRYNASVPFPHLRSEEPFFGLNETEIDAVRALGCLVEYDADHRHFRKKIQIVTDLSVAVDLIEQRVDTMEKEAVERQEQESKKGGDDKSQQRLKDKRRADNQKREKDKVAAEGFNEVLLGGLMNRNAPARRKHGLARKKAIAKVLLANNPDLAGGGLRLVRPALKGIETKAVKGEERRKVRYADPRQANAWLNDQIDAARSEGEVEDLLTESIICALVADGKAVAMSNRVTWHCTVAEELRELLGAEIEEVAPRGAAGVRRRRTGRRGKKAAA